MAVGLLLAAVVSAQAAPPQAFISATRVNVRAGPSTSFKLVAKASQGEPVEVLSRRNRWVEVRLRSGTIGWVSESLLGLQRTARRQYWSPRPARQYKHEPQPSTPARRATGGESIGEVWAWVRLLGGGVLAAVSVVVLEAGHGGTKGIALFGVLGGIGVGAWGAYDLHRMGWPGFADTRPAIPMIQWSWSF